MKECEDIIARHVDPQFAGFAGAGKSYLLRHALCCAASLGLEVLVSSSCAEQAGDFGSAHLHALFGLDVKGTAKQLAVILGNNDAGGRRQR